MGKFRVSRITQSQPPSKLPQCRPTARAHFSICQLAKHFDARYLTVPNATGVSHLYGYLF